MNTRVHIAAAILSVTVVVSTLALSCNYAFASEGSAVIPSNAIDEFTVAGESSDSTGLALDQEGSMWFTETAPGRITRISPTGNITGEFAILFGEMIPEWPEEFSEPSSLAPGRNGIMWFTDRGTNKEGQSFVGNVTPTGRITEFPIPTVGSMPAGIALGADDDMWFTEEGAGKIGRVTEDGAVTEYSIPGTERQEFMRPQAIALGADGNMWFTDVGLSDTGQNLIGRITPEGNITEFPIPIPYDHPEAIALGADGGMWFTESPDAIGRITPTGTFSEFAVPSVGASENGIVRGPDGNIWFTESSNAVGRITPTGSVTSFEGIPPSKGIPLALAQGVGDNTWFAEGNRIGRFDTPVEPVNQALPAISGQPAEGQVLSVSQGSWSHAPSAFGYQWQICDASGANCTNLAGQTEPTHTLATSEIGHTLRAVVTASNIAGAVSAISEVSAMVQAAQHAPELVVPKLIVADEPLPVVDAAMTWNFGWARAYTTVTSLVVHDIPAGGIVEITCRGKGCAFKHQRLSAPRRSVTPCKHARCKAAQQVVVHGEVNLAKLFQGRRLTVGVHIVITVLKAGWVGKEFVFAVRANRPPETQITCLGSGPGTTVGEC